MSSNNRARNRAIRSEMAESGQNYTRAARSASRPSRQLRAVCITCRKEIPDDEGVIHIAHREVNQVEQAQDDLRKQRAAKAAAEGRPGGLQVFTANEIMAWPHAARWQVHCNGCNPHVDADGKGWCSGCYWFGVERCRTWAQLVDWTAHLMEKDWAPRATNWTDFIRTAAHGSSPVGLICNPADRYVDG